MSEPAPGAPHTAHATHAAIAAVWRLESGAVVGALTRLLRDISLAEEMAQDALMAALDHWPREGLPSKPGAWLMTTAKHKALDHLKRCVPPYGNGSVKRKRSVLIGHVNGRRPPVEHGLDQLRAAGS